MLNYYLQVNTSIKQCLSIQVLVGDEIIMEKCYPIDPNNGNVQIGNTEYCQDKMNEFISDILQNNTTTFTFTFNDSMSYNAETEEFKFTYSDIDVSHVTTCVMSDKKREQFTTELENINRHIRNICSS